MSSDAPSSDGGRGATAPRPDAVAIVTGASHGIGREVVRMLARRGYAIVVVYLDEQSSAEATVEEVFAVAGTAVAVRADITDDLDVERLFDETIAAFGGVDAVVHTTMRTASVLYGHAARRLHRGSAIVILSVAGEISSAFDRELRDRDITVIRAAGAEQGVDALISFLNRSGHPPIG